MKWLAPVSCVLAVAYATPQATGTGDKGQACPGSIQGNGGGVDDNYCCVGGSAQVSNCPGWPICSGAPTTTAKPVSCATKITLTDSDYFELVSSASSKYLDGNGSIKASATATSEGNEAQATQSDGSTSSAATTADSAPNAAPTFAVNAAAKAAGVLMVYAALQ